MSSTSDFHDFIVYDLMRELPRISSRKMMSGWCVYSDKKPFAFIIDNRLYFKARGDFAKKLATLGAEQFSYYKKGVRKLVRMCYWSATDDMLEDQDLFLNIARETIARSKLDK